MYVRILPNLSLMSDQKNTNNNNNNNKRRQFKDVARENLPFLQELARKPQRECIQVFSNTCGGRPVIARGLLIGLLLEPLVLPLNQVERVRIYGQKEGSGQSQGGQFVGIGIQFWPLGKRLFKKGQEGKG